MKTSLEQSRLCPTANIDQTALPVIAKQSRAVAVAISALQRFIIIYWKREWCIREFGGRRDLDNFCEKAG
jgi:hypothetical protein